MGRKEKEGVRKGKEGKKGGMEGKKGETEGRVEAGGKEGKGVKGKGGCPHSDF